MGVLAKPIPFGDYFLLEKINTGGMAEVYKAKTFGAEGFERIVAVKKILPSIAEDKEFITMFINEAKLAVQLTHANIAQINDLGNINGDYYIAMEYVPGHDLRVIFDRCVRMNCKLDIGCVCYIISKICEGLDFAHNKKDSNGNPMNIIHRDISPQNILISYEGECKLIDFGIAKATNQSNATQVGILKGKFSYMSPEQVSGKANIDRRSDIFALGIVLFELLTLKRLFLGSSDFETLEKIRKVEVSPPTLYNSAIPEELEDIVLKALEKDVSQRYQTAQELQEALQRFMFKQNLYYTAKDLSEFCHSMFAQEIALEQKKMEFYKELTKDVLMQSRKSIPEDESSFYAQHNMPHMSGVQFEVQDGGKGGKSPAPKQAIYAELDDFEPPKGDSIVYSAKNGGNGAHGGSEVGDLILAPVAAHQQGPVPRKSLVSADAVIVNKGRETVLTAPVKKDSSRSAYITIAVILVLIIAGLVAWAALRPKDSGDGIAQFVVWPGDVKVRLEINNQEGKTGLASPISVERLSTMHETRYRLTADGFQPAEGVFMATPDGTNIEVKLQPLHESKLSIYVDLDMVDVMVDGRRINGNRQFVVNDITPGEHIVSVSKDGYKTEERRLHFKVGESVSLTPELRPEFATLVLKAEPYEAKYVLKNRRTGVSQTGTTDAEGVTISDLPADDEYDITIYDGEEPLQAVWQPNVRLANQAEVRTFPTTHNPAGEAAVAVAPEAAAAPAAAPAAPEPVKTAPKPSANKKPRKVAKEDDDGDVVVKSTTPTAAPAAPAPAPAADANTPGQIHIGSKPPAKIFVNGVEKGETYRTLTLSPGTYTIRLVNTEAGINEERSVTLKAGGTEKVFIRK